MNNKIKDAYSNINISKELEEKIFNMTINKKERKKFLLKYLIASVSIFVICISMVTIAYADEIKEIIKSWTSSVEFEDGTHETIIENQTFKKIPSTAPKTKEKEPMISMTVSEIEEILGFKILKLRQSSSNEIGYETFLNKNGQIGRLGLWWAMFLFENEKKYISMSIDMLNENADNGYISAFMSSEGIDASGGKEIETTYISNNLGVKIIIYSNNWSNERLTAVFCYDNIIYQLIGNNYSEQEIKDVIEKLEF